MSQSHVTSDSLAQVQQQLANVLEEITEKIEAGQPIDLDQYKRKHPELADRLEQLVPAVAVLESLGLSAGKKPIDALSDPEHRELGDFRIIREIGRGGMGVVYEAEQLSLGRHVALKVLPFAAVLDPRQLRRFKEEAQAAALLKHASIVSVHSVGCERGVHYYAMEFSIGI